MQILVPELESEVERACYKEAQRNKCRLLKIKGTKGWPDRLLILPNGKVAFLELKRRTGIVEPLQEYILEELQKMGFRATVVYSVEQFRKILTDLLLPSGTQNHTSFVG